MADVFISYAREDQPFVRRLHQALADRGRETWVDWEGIPPSALWMAEVRQAIEGANAFIFVVSPDSIESSVCREEVEHAAAANKRLVPIVRRDADARLVPEAVAAHNWIFLRDDDDFDRGVEQLLTALETDQDWVHSHTRLLVRAREWEAKGRPASLVLRGDDLKDAETWLGSAAGKKPEPTPLHSEYIVASRRAATGRQRVVFGAVAMALLVSIVLSIFALIQRSQAVHQATIAEARGLAAQATALVRTRLDQSLLLAVQALRMDDDQQSRAGLLTALDGARYLDAFHDELGNDLAPGVTVSRDGNSIATATRGGVITVWNAKTSVAEVHLGPVAGISSISLTENGNLIAVADEAGVRLWATHSGDPVGRPFAPSGTHNAATYYADLSPDGSELMIQDISQPILTITVFRVDDHAKLAVLHLQHLPASAGTASFTADGRSILLAGAGLIASFDARTGRPQIPVTRFGDREVSTVGPATSRAGDYVAVAASSFSPVRIRLLDASSFTPVGPPLTMGTGGRLYGLAFSPDGRRLAAETDDGAVTLFDIPDGTLSATLTGRLGFATGMGWLTSDRLVSSTSDGVIQWNLTRSSALGNPIQQGDGFLPEVGFLGDGRLAFSDRYRLTIDADTPDPQTIDLKPLCGGGISTPRSGELVAVSCQQGVELVDVAQRRVVKTFPVAGFLPIGVLSPDARYLALSGNGSLSVVMVATGETVMPPTKLDDYLLNALAWTPDGRTLMVGGQQGDVIFIDTKTWRPMDRLTLEPQSLDLADFAVDPDGRRMFVASESGRVWVVDIKQRTIDGQPLTASGTQLEGVALSPDGNTVAAISRDGALRLWETGSRRPIGPALHGYAVEATSVAWGKRGLFTAGTTNINLAKGEASAGLLRWDLDAAKLADAACGFVQRNLTHVEWSEFVGNVQYRVTCPGFPPGI